MLTKKLSIQYLCGIVRTHCRPFCAGSTNRNERKAEVPPEVPGELIQFGAMLTENSEMKKEVVDTMLVLPNFVTVEEEQSLMKELEPYLKRLHYEASHWDDAIHKYRETERSRWKKNNELILDRVRVLAFPPPVFPMKFVHVLDLAEDGVIKPHVDSVRFCGNTIAGLSLLSSSVMRLRLEEDRNAYCDVLLPRLSLYVMKDFVRYKFAHEILADSESLFNGEKVPRGRRVSVICRNEPPMDKSTGGKIFDHVKPLPPE